MSEPMILPVKPGTVSELDKAKMAEVGVVVIEHPNPEEVRLLRAHGEIPAGMLLRCALRALAHQNADVMGSGPNRFKFFQLLAEGIEKDDATRTEALP